ncbi:rCG51521, partial [Rattus norvegicus]
MTEALRVYILCEKKGQIQLWLKGVTVREQLENHTVESCHHHLS